MIQYLKIIHLNRLCFEVRFCEKITQKLKRILNKHQPNVKQNGLWKNIIQSISIDHKH